MVHLAGCRGGGGGGSGSPVPRTSHSVTLNWAPNHEKGVNSLGGGYRVSITGQPTITVPFTTAPPTPTTTAITLQTGIYSVTVVAFAKLDAQGGVNGSGSVSAPSQTLTVTVP